MTPCLQKQLPAHTALPSGTRVQVTLDDGSSWQTKTRSEPWRLASGHWVVLIEGRVGGYSLDRVTPISDHIQIT